MSADWNDPVAWATFAPALALLGALVNGLFGRRLREPLPGLIATAAVAGAFALALVAFFGLLGREAGRGRDPLALPAGRRPGPVRRLRDRLAVGDLPAGHHRRRARDPRLLDRLHARRRRVRALLRAPEPVRRLDADPGPGGLARAALHRLGRRGRLLLPAHRLLVPPDGERRRRPEGLHRQPDRRRRLPARELPGRGDVRHPDDRRGQRRRRHVRLRRGRARHDRAALPARRHRQERAAAAPRLAARRDGGPHPGLGAHPRRDHGHRGRVPDRAPQPALRDDARRVRRRCLGRRPHGPRGGDRRDGADRRQAHPGVLHRQPTRLHVRRRRRGRVRGRRVPRGHARVLQGAALPRRRLRDPRAWAASRTCAGWGGWARA